MAPAGEKPPLQLSDFQAETIRGTPGFVRLGRARTGTWWLIGPDDRPFFACGVAIGPAVTRLAPTAQAAAWGVNTMVVEGGSPPSDWTGTWVASIRLRPSSPEAMIRLQGVQLPDVFAPGWARSCRERATEACHIGAADPRLLGWLPDADLQWAPGWPARPTLLQVCLSLEPRFAAYHAAWEFVLAAHGGDLSAVAAAWEVELPNKESLRLLTHDDRPVGGQGYRHDDDRFAREFARLYFSAVVSAIRAEDPVHLIMGSIPSAGFTPVADGAAAVVDLLAAEPGAGISGSQLDAWSRDGAMALFLGKYTWAAGGMESTPGRTPLEGMLAGGRVALHALVSHPAAVGYAWRDWRDLPDDRPPFGRGLVRVDGTNAREHTDLLTEINLGAEIMHRASHS